MNSTDPLRNSCALPEEDWRADADAQDEDEDAVGEIVEGEDESASVESAPAAVMGPVPRPAAPTAAPNVTSAPTKEPPTMRPLTKENGGEETVEEAVDSPTDDAGADQEEDLAPLPPAPEWAVRWIRKGAKHPQLPLRLPHWRRIIHRVCCTPAHAHAELLAAVRTVRRPTGQHRLALEFFEQLLCYSKRKNACSTAPLADELVWVSTSTLKHLLSWEVSSSVLHIGGGAARGGGGSRATSTSLGTDQHAKMVQTKVAKVS
jgi:hypothetical protein